MTKNKLVKASTAALFITSAIVPVASANVTAESATDILDVVIKLEDGTFVKFDIGEYGSLLAFERIKNTNVTHVIDNVGNVYDIGVYGSALAITSGDPEKALAGLLNEQQTEDITIVQGDVEEDGTVVVKDQTPEENLNETFFYNLVA